MPTIKVKTQTRFRVLFTSRSTAHLGEISRHLTWHLPQVFAYYPPLTINSLHLYRNYMMTKYAFFANKSGEMEEGYGPLVGKFQCLPLPLSH